MKKLLLLKLLILLLSISVLSQGIDNTNIEKITKEIVDEGKRIYKLELASWHGTDTFLNSYKDQNNIGGYFSYVNNDTVKCIFFSREPVPGVIGTILFDTTFNPQKTICNLSKRNFTANELELYTIRTNALKEIVKDTLYKFYEDMSINLVPLISPNERVVYALTGPKKNDVIIFGNDLLIKLNDSNKVIMIQKLHQNIIPINYNYEKNKEDIEIVTYHNHNKETSDFITPTDICTLMLYAKLTNWKTHIVISKNYVNVWNCQLKRLTILTKDEFKRIMIGNDQEK